MRKIFLLPFLSIIIVGCFSMNSSGPVMTTLSDTSFSGYVSATQIWNGTINITGDVIIKSGGSVTIEPGTIVRFAAQSDDKQLGGNTLVSDSNYPLDPDIYFSQISTILVQDGTLSAIGTSDNRITFTSSAASPNATHWHGIQYSNSSGKMDIQYSDIEYAYGGIFINAGCTSQDVTIKHNSIKHMITSGISFAKDVSAIELTVESNEISDCGHEAIAIYNSADVIVSSNNITHNEGSYGDSSIGGNGITIDDGSAYIIDNSFVSNNVTINIVSSAGTVTLTENIFQD